MKKQFLNPQATKSMKTVEKALLIEEMLKSREFRDKLREHPIIKNKVERAKKDLAAMKAMEHVKEKDTRN